jgi:glycosyltransferase involved in cell wall biosynthesis
VLAGSGLLFDPEAPESIATALRRLVTSAELRQRLAREAHLRAQAFSWERCARETLAFLRQTYDERAAPNRA